MKSSYLLSCMVSKKFIMKNYKKNFIWKNISLFELEGGFNGPHNVILKPDILEFKC